MTTLTPEAKQLLSTTVRALRERLLRDVHDEADRRYRLSVAIDKAGLDEAHRRRRERLDAWLDERVRAAKPKNKKDEAAVRARLLEGAEKEAAATFLNRVVLLRHLEALKLSKVEVVTGGWKSKGYREFREFAPGLMGDESEGYALLLELVFDDLSVDLPGLFGDVGLTKLFPIPPAALREVIERLDDEGLASAWTDDTTLGWVYQYWNDPEREALDAKINGGGKIEPHEIASKTQMFTERYMVEWLLQNSLGLLWLSMCKKNRWTADAESVLPVLDARRAQWRVRREAGEVALDALMPIEDGLEARWKYYIQQPIPDDAVARAPRSIREVKLLDPACGSGHFLVIAFDLLAALYREEATHTSGTVSAREIAESILENNLHGIDIDTRAIQIAAAGLYVKARSLAKDARPKRLNLVAPALQLANLRDDDAALVALRRELKDDAGIPEALTNGIVRALEGVDHLGSLLKVDAAIKDAVEASDQSLSRARGQGHLFEGFASEKVSPQVAKVTTLDAIERFVAQRSQSSDLGLRLDGEQLAAGVRFLRIAKEGAYDVVVGNPPYQGTSKMANAGYVARYYPRGKADLYAAFLERGLELARPGGISALLTMRGWMFLAQFVELRKHLVHAHGLSTLGDVDRGAFEDVPDEVLSTVMSVFRRDATGVRLAVAMQPTPLDDRTRDGARTNRKRAAVLAQVGRHEFDPRGFEVIEGEPIVYWWTKEFLARYAAAPKLSEAGFVSLGLSTSDNPRFLRRVWEVAFTCVERVGVCHYRLHGSRWVPLVSGASGASWVCPLSEVVRWDELLSGASTRGRRNAAQPRLILHTRCRIHADGQPVFGPPPSIRECLRCRRSVRIRCLLRLAVLRVQHELGRRPDDHGIAQSDDYLHGRRRRTLASIRYR